MAEIVIIHGTKGSPEANWYPWLAKELSNLGHCVSVPRMPTPTSQSLSNWQRAFSSETAKLDDSTILIGHSLGAVFVLRVLESLDRQICGAILVSGFCGALGLPEYDELNKSFTAGLFNWEAIKRNAKQVIVINGREDPYVPRGEGLLLASNLGVTPIDVASGKHLNSEAGYDTFPLLLTEVTTLIQG